MDSWHQLNVNELLWINWLLFVSMGFNVFIVCSQHSFCRPCYSSRAEFCPLDNAQLSMVVRNLAVSLLYYGCSTFTLSLCHWLQIADQVGELLIHCRYGCKPSQENVGSYEIDTTGSQSPPSNYSIVVETIVAFFANLNPWI